MPRVFQSPLVIGAVGGSGTRVVAAIFREAGVYLGKDLNKPHDNLVFTRLFKHPEWKRDATRNEIAARLELFEQYMTGVGFGANERKRLLQIMRRNPHYSTSKFYRWKLPREVTQKTSTWGWKEPNTQLYLEELANYFPSMRYILVVRNGLDMAFSRNVQQLIHWGDLYGVEKPEDVEKTPCAQLDYWIRVTNDALEKGRRLLGDRFHVLDFEKLWKQPERKVPELLEFAGLQVSR